MKKENLLFRIKTHWLACISPTGAGKWLLLYVFFMMALSPSLYAQGWGTVPAPSSETVLKDLGLFGKIKKSVWSGSNKLAGTEQVLHMAELNFNYPSDYELKIAYVYNDPVTFNPISPAECREICYYITCTSGAECINGLQRFCEPVAGPQFDFVSHVAAKYGAVMATNGAFYDYFYNCVPGVKSYIKVDNSVVSKPNVLNHRNEGALAFDFSGTSPRIAIAKRTATTLEQLDANTIYGTDLSSYPNVMSGGHLIENGSPYVLSTPSFCNGITYPWSSDPTLTGTNDILKKSGKDWRDFACPTLPLAANQQSDVPITPTAYGYQNFFKCSNLSDITKRRQLTCVDYAKYGEEFGGSDGLAKRSRTFIGIKGNTFYWFVADGCISTVTTPNGDARCKGFTIEELADLANKMGLDKLLNFDGGSSSVFYMAGKGVLQFQYDPSSPTSVVRVGPQGQRLLQSVLMLVPKKEVLSTVYAGGTFSGYATIKNKTARPSVAPVSYIDLTPAIDKIGSKAGVFGKFKTEDLRRSDGVYTEVGQVLFSYVKDQKGPIKEGIVAGIGRMPAELNTMVMATPKGPGINQRAFEEFQAAVTENKLKYWAVVFRQGSIAGFDVYPKSYDDRWFHYDAPEPFDGEWHSFMIQGTSYTHDCFTCAPLSGDVLVKPKFRFFIDGYDANSSINSQGTELSSIFESGRLFTTGINSITIGAMVNNGQYIAGDVGSNGPTEVKLDVQDFLFSSNFDNYYEYSVSDDNAGRKYGDPEKEFNYYKSRDWTSDLFDEMHTNQTPGDDGNTIFCFDEAPGTRMLYAWYRGTTDPNTRTRKAFGVYMNDVAFENKSAVMKRDVNDTKQFDRAMYRIANFSEKTHLVSADFTPSASSGRAVGAINSWASASTSPNRTNTFMVEQMGPAQFLISNPGFYTLKHSSSTTDAVTTTMNVTPNDPEIYWDIQQAMTENTFYIKHKNSSTYLTCGADGASLTLEAFDPLNHKQVWTFQRVGEAQKVIQPNYYNVINTPSGGTRKIAWAESGSSISIVDYATSTEKQGVWIDYIGADFYRMQMKYNGENTYLKFSGTPPFFINSNYYPVNKMSGQAMTDHANIHIKINSNGEVQFHRGQVIDNEIYLYTVHNFTDNMVSLPSYVRMARRHLIGDNGGTFSDGNWSDVNYTLELMENKKKLTPGTYQLSSLANQALVATLIPTTTPTGFPIQAQPDNNNPNNHAWEFLDAGLGKYYLKALDGPYFDIAANKWTAGALSTRKALDVATNADGSITLKYNNQCLTDNGSGQEYTLTTCSNSNNQKFLAHTNKNQTFQNLNKGFYKIVNKSSSKALLHNWNGDPSAPESAAYLVQGTYVKDGDYKDEWLVEPVGNNEYLISNRSTYRVMDIVAASIAENARIWNYMLNKTPAQRFKLLPTGDGFFQIRNVNSYKCIDLYQNSPADGAYYQQLTCRTATDALVNAQKFAFEWIDNPLLPVELNDWYTMNNSSVSGAGGAGIFPLTFSDENAVKYGDFQNVNKSDLWSFLYRGAQLYTIQLKGSLKLLTAGNTAVNNSYDVVQRSLSPEEEKTEQYWALTDNLNGVKTAEGTYKIFSALYPAHTLQPAAMAVNGNRFLHVNPVGSSAGDWKLTKVAEPLIDGSFRIEKYDGGTGLDITSARNDVYINAFSSEFKFELQSDGYYKISHPTLNSVMTANAVGTLVEKATWNAADRKQRWSVEYTGTNGQYRIINKEFSNAIWNDFISGHQAQLRGWANFGDRKYRLTGTGGSISPLAAMKFEPVTDASTKKSPLTVYPNPTRGDIIVELAFEQVPGVKTYYFELFDMAGRRVYNTRKDVNAASDAPIQLYNLKSSAGIKSGIYILKITSADGKVLGTKNIVVL